MCRLCRHSGNNLYVTDAPVLLWYESRHFACCISLVRVRCASFHVADRNNTDTT
jgi:hypothetical protein